MEIDSDNTTQSTKQCKTINITEKKTYIQIIMRVLDEVLAPFHGLHLLSNILNVYYIISQDLGSQTPWLNKKDDLLDKRVQGDDKFI